MASSMFTVKERVFPGQHIRHFDRGNRHRDEDTQYIATKQYIPLNNPTPQDGDITIIAASATSFPKEVYEPLWSALLQQCTNHGLRIRSIWVADRSDHAASATVNEDVLGDDPSPLDQARDLLCMVNTYRDEFPTPIVGFGHSMGGSALLELSRLHPRLFAALVLIDAIIGPEIYRIGIPLIHSAAQRPDLWSSRQEAEKFLREKGGMKRWHSDALQAYLDHGLRETPTKLYPEPGKVTLSTTKANESYTYVRGCFDQHISDKERKNARYPDWDVWTPASFPFYRVEGLQLWNDLPLLRPSVLYLIPQYGPFSHPKQVEDLVSRTGTGAGGSGGRDVGRVRHEVLKGRSHLVPVEDPEVVAETMVEFLIPELKAWAKRREVAREDGDGRSFANPGLTEEWKARAAMWFADTGPKRTKAKM